MTPGEAPAPPTDEEAAPSRAGGRLDAARARAQAASERLTAARGRHASVDTSFELVERDRRIAASVMAGGIAFRLFLWLLPLALVLFGVLGFASTAAAEEAVQDVGLTEAASDAIAASVEEAGQGRWALLLIGLGSLLWTSSRSVLALRRVYALVWDVPPVRSGNPLLESLAFSGICIAVLAIPAGADWVRGISPTPGFAMTLLVVAAYFGIWLWISLWLPHGDAPLRALVPGAVVFAVAAQLMHLFTVYYLNDKLERSSALYGGLGLAATILFALYIVGRLVISSAVLNAELWRRSVVRSDAESNSPG